MSAAPATDARITAVVATRNRGDSAVMAVRSLLLSDHPSFGVVVVDQSDDDSTRSALAPFESDPRYLYIHSDTPGVGRAQNLAASMIASPLIAFTDDDCEVDAAWLVELVGTLRATDAAAAGGAQLAYPRPERGHRPPSPAPFRRRMRT